MKKFRVTDVYVAIHSGVLGLTEHQASLRTYGLKPIGDGKYEVKETVQFKRGEEFEWDGDVPRALAAQIEESDGAKQPERNEQQDEDGEMSFEPTLHEAAPAPSDHEEEDSILHSGSKNKHGRRK